MIAQVPVSMASVFDSSHPFPHATPVRLVLAFSPLCQIHTKRAVSGTLEPTCSQPRHVCKYACICHRHKASTTLPIVGDNPLATPGITPVSAAGMDQKEAGGSAAAPAPLAEAGAGGDEAGAAQPIRSLSAWLKEVRGSEAA